LAQSGKIPILFYREWANRLNLRCLLRNPEVQCQIVILSCQTLPVPE